MKYDNLPGVSLGRLDGRVHRLPVSGNTVNGSVVVCARISPGVRDFGESSKEGAA